MNRFCSSRDLPHDVHRVALHIAKKAQDLGLVAGRLPNSVAAASIYVAYQVSEKQKTLREISDITGVGVVTLWKVTRQMRPRAQELFHDDFYDMA